MDFFILFFDISDAFQSETAAAKIEISTGIDYLQAFNISSAVFTSVTKTFSG